MYFCLRPWIINHRSYNCSKFENQLWYMTLWYWFQIRVTGSGVTTASAFRASGRATDCRTVRSRWPPSEVKTRRDAWPVQWIQPTAVSCLACPVNPNNRCELPGLSSEPKQPLWVAWPVQLTQTTAVSCLACPVNPNNRCELPGLSSEPKQPLWVAWPVQLTQTTAVSCLACPVNPNNRCELPGLSS